MPLFSLQNCRQIDQIDIADAEFLPCPVGSDIVELLQDWRLHRPDMARELDPIIESVLALEGKGGAS